MSATDGPIVPGRSGSDADLFEPSRVMVTDPFAVLLMRVSHSWSVAQNKGGSGAGATFALAAKGVERRSARGPECLRLAEPSPGGARLRPQRLTAPLDDTHGEAASVAAPSAAELR